MGSTPKPPFTPSGPWRAIPRIAESHHELGRAFLEQGRLDLAEPCFREALQIDPDLSISWIALARLQAERGDFDLSCASARSALAVNPRLTDALWATGR